MSQRKRRDGNILDRIDPELDPGSLLKPMGQPKAEPICHCLLPQKNQLGGMKPKMDLEAMEVRCGTCLKVIGPSCRRREVTHLRGLLKLKETHPEMVDLDDCHAAGFVLDYQSTD